MNALLVNYRLWKKGQDYSAIHKALESFPHTKLGTSSYVILTEYAPEVLTLVLRGTGTVDANDEVYVFQLAGPWDGHGPNNALNWLRSNVRSE